PLQVPTQVCSSILSRKPGPARRRQPCHFPGRTRSDGDSESRGQPTHHGAFIASARKPPETRNRLLRKLVQYLHSSGDGYYCVRKTASISVQSTVGVAM